MPKGPSIFQQDIDPDKIARAKELRRSMTPAEKALWRVLRTNQFSGYHFRRQQVIAGYIVDFYCHAAGLIIELDGEIHRSQVAEDAQWDEQLKALGFRVVRIANRRVLEEIECVLAEIKTLLPQI
jgi:very-short-patch-repair endonuclease